MIAQESHLEPDSTDLSATEQIMMKRPSYWRLLCLSLALIVVSSLSSAQLVNGRFITSVYAWEQFDTIGVSKKLVRGFQSALFDIAGSSFSLHTHVQGASLLQSTLDEVPDYRVFYLYGRLKNVSDAVDFSFGRMPYFAGVGNGTLDGILTTIRLSDNRFRITAYGGGNVPLDLELNGWKPLSKSFTAGGQILTTAIANMRVGISFVNRQRERESYWAIRPDPLLNPLTVYITPPPAKEQYASADVSYRVSSVSLYGRYDYDLNYEKIQRGQVGVRAGLTDELSATGDFIHRTPRLPFNSFFAVFSAEAIDEFEGGLDYVIIPELRTYARGAFVQYDNDNSFRYTLGFAHHFVSLIYRGNTGYAGELNSISLQGTYPLFERMFIPSAGFTYASYRLNAAAEKDDMIAGSLGAICRPINAFSIDLQVQWLKNKIVKSDTRLFGKLNYWFTEQLDIF